MSVAFALLLICSLLYIWRAYICIVEPLARSPQAASLITTLTTLINADS